MLTPDSAPVGSGYDDRWREIEARLRATYGQPRHHNPEDPLDDLVFLVLSRMTQEVKYVRTYRALKERFADWQGVRDAPRDALEDLLTDAGLASTKSAQLQGILEEIQRREGGLSLARLRGLSDSEAEAYLASLPGVSTKTARCVMLYTLGRDTFPVDAHVWRVAQRLGLAPKRPWSDRAGRELQDRVPPGLRGSLHRTLIAHGRMLCRARGPRCGGCVLADLCPSVGTAPRRPVKPQ